MRPRYVSANLRHALAAVRAVDLGPLPEWDLSDLYAGLDDPAFAADLARADSGIRPRPGRGRRRRPGRRGRHRGPTGPIPAAGRGRVLPIRLPSQRILPSMSSRALPRRAAAPSELPLSAALAAVRARRPLAPINRRRGSGPGATPPRRARPCVARGASRRRTGGLRGAVSFRAGCCVRSVKSCLTSIASFLAAAEGSSGSEGGWAGPPDISAPPCPNQPPAGLRPRCELRGAVSFRAGCCVRSVKSCLTSIASFLAAGAKPRAPRRDAPCAAASHRGRSPAGG
jgi:hypothetical protein